LRGGFRQFEITPYKVPPAAFTNWNEVLNHPQDISLVTLQTGAIRMDACLNLDPASPKQMECDHAPRNLAALVHWVHHPRFGDFLIDAGFDDSFAKHPPYGNYTEAMKLFNWVNARSHRRGSRIGSTNRAHFLQAEPSFLARAAVANHFSGKTKFSSLDFLAAPRMAPLGASIDLFGDGSLWAISVTGHTDDDIAYLINGLQPVLLTGDASHLEWAFEAGVAPRGWNKEGTARAY